MVIYLFAGVSVLANLVILLKVMSLKAQLEDIQEILQQVNAEKEHETKSTPGIVKILAFIGLVVVLAACPYVARVIFMQ